MAQNSSVFVWRASNYSRGRSDLRNDMNQVTNLNSLEKNSKFTVSFSWCCFMRHSLLWFLWCCFWSPHISSKIRFVIDCVVKLVLFVSVADSPASTLRSCLLSPVLPPSLVLGNSLPNSCVTDGCWFSFFSPFTMFSKSINDCTIIFDASSLFMIQEWCTSNRLSVLS